jgi:hypothetical protein
MMVKCQANPRIVILGGYGTFGSLIAEQLAWSGAQLIIAGRDASKGQAFAASLKASFIRCDTRSRVSLRDTTSSAQLVINASGPFQAKDYSIPQTCIEQGCHYIDLGDGREYVAGIAQLHESAKANDVFVCVGASTTPAITSAAVAELRPHFQQIRSIKVALTAGNKNQAGVSTIASILAYVGLPVRVWQDGKWRELTGWGMGEFIDFPKPVGRRRVQLCDFRGNQSQGHQFALSPGRLVMARSHYLGMGGDFRTGQYARFRGIFTYNSHTRLSDLERGPENTILYAEYWGGYVDWNHLGGVPSGWTNGSRSVGFNYSAFGTCPGTGNCDYQHSFGLSFGIFGALHPGLLANHPYTFNVAMADGSVRSLPGNIDFALWETLCGIHGGGNPVGRLEPEEPWAGIDY